MYRTLYVAKDAFPFMHIKYIAIIDDIKYFYNIERMYQLVYHLARKIDS